MNAPAYHAPTVICGHCGAPTWATAMDRCRECGSPVRILEPLAVQCGWCAASQRRDQTADCQLCGGPLPCLPGGHPGPRPAPVPRALPAGYAERVKYWKNVEVLLGMVFTIVFCWSICFPIVGMAFWRRGAERARRKLHALVHGVPTGARIVAVQVDTSQHINHQHPWSVRYQFETPGGWLSGQCTAWDPFVAAYRPGDAVWVVYSEDDPASNALWPPVR